MPAPAPPRTTLSVLDGIAMMVGVVIGIGIFKTPQLVALNVDSEFGFVAIWVIGGLATLTGALVYAELAAAYPSTGGEYHFLHRAFGANIAVLFAWARISVIQTGAIAAVAFVFGDYANGVVPLGPSGSAIYAGLSVTILTCVNLWGTHLTKNFQIGLTALTFLAILAVAVAGLLLPAPSAATTTAATAPASTAAGLALVFVLLTYGGWNEAAYLSAELHDTRRGIIKVLVFGVLALIVLYTAVNLAYLRVLGLPGLRQSEIAAADLMRHTLGSGGALVLSAVICAEALSTINATIFTGARVYHALGRDLPLLRNLGVWSERGDAPINAILAQGAITCALILLGAFTPDGFKAMVEYTAPVFWFFLLLVGLSLFVLRRRDPNRERPFMVPLYPLLPALFCLTCVYLLYSSLAYTGFGALVGVAVLAAGLPLLLLGRPADAIDAE